MTSSQRIALWLLQARRMGHRACKRCGGLVEASYDPDPRNGLGIFTRCWSCGALTCELCQPHGFTRPMRPPETYIAIEAQIRAMKSIDDYPESEVNHAA